MVMTDPIGDMLTIIRNGLMVQKATVECPYATVKVQILGVLQEEGFISSFKVLEPSVAGKSIKIYLKFGPKGEKIINKIVRVSTPGRHLYARTGDLRPVRNGMGITILSTSRGVMSDRKARQDKVGGEILCKVW
jgi:small subunit ribosomal protein S8